MKRFRPVRLLVVVVVLVFLALSPACKKGKKVKPPTNVIPQHEALIRDFVQLAAQGRYSEAQGACTDFLHNYPQSPVLDHALFQCAIIYASDQNPQRDLARSLGLFQQITQQMPLSDYTPGARVVIRLVQGLSALQDTYAHQAADLKAMHDSDTQQKQTIKDLQGLQAQHLRLIRELQIEIEKMKKIDLNKHP